jgi:predicted TPR repeat methyltransferase
MLSRAEEKGLYDELLSGDAVELLGNSEDTFDLVLCCDTLPYVGDLAPLLSTLAARTAAGGHFLCTTELVDGGSYKLQTSARFAHSPEYVIEQASAAGFDLLAQKTIALRKDRLAWTSGGIYCFVRRAAVQ